MSVSTILTSKRTISAIACSLSLAAMAATPVAVWDGDFSPSELTKFAGYTLVDWNETHGGVSHESGATDVDYSSVTIDRANAGLMCQFGAAKGAFTVLVKYSGLAKSDSSKRVVFATTANNDWTYDRCGIRLLTDDTLLGLWNNPNSGNNDADYPSNTAGSGSLPASGTAAYVYSSSTGTFVYSTGSGDGAISDTAVWSHGDLKAGNMTGVAVGGMWQSANVSGAEAAKGMTIKSLAVFDRVLTVAEMNAYIWPSEVQTIPVTDSITVSAINSQIDANTYKTVKIVAEDGATITVDKAFSTTLPIAVSNTGSIALSAASQPDASYFTGVDFSGVQGAVLRSWLPTPGVVGFNFNADGYRSDNTTTTDGGSGDTSLALVTGTWYSNARDASGSSAALFSDGISKLTWSSANVYAEKPNLSTGTFVQGYLDDGANGGNGATVMLSGVPYETYDVVIYASTDNGSGFMAKTVNGTAYTWGAVQSAAIAGSASWGKIGVPIAVYGQNALRIKNLSGLLSISGGARAGSSTVRGGIAAIQIMPTDAPDVVKAYTLTLDGKATTWSAGTWTLDGATVSAPTVAGNVVINATASTTLTIDADVALGDVTVNGGENIVVTLALGEKTAASGDTAATYYSLYANKVTVQSGVLRQGSAAVLGTTPAVAVADGATFDLNGLAVSESNAFYIEGAGSGDWPWALTSSGGDFPTGTLRGFTLTGDATIGGANKIGCGNLNVASNLGFGTYTLTKTGNGELSFTNIRSARGSAGAFDIKGGLVTLNKWTNLDGSNLDNGGRPWASTAVSVRSGASLESKIERWVWIGSLDLAGGTITTESNPFAIQTVLTGSGTLDRVVLDNGASATLSGDLTVTTALSLSGSASFEKAQDAVGDVTVTPSGTFTSSSTDTISIGEGVVFNLGVNRIDSPLAVDGKLVVRLSNDAEKFSLNVTKEPAAVVVNGSDGTDQTANMVLSYDGDAGTYTITPSRNTWTNKADDGSFDNDVNWSSGSKPVESQNVVIDVADETAISVNGTYNLGQMAIRGGGVATFSGTGKVVADSMAIINASTLDTNNKVLFGALALEPSTTGIVASVENLVKGGLTGSGTFVLDLGDGKTNTMSSANTSFTGDVIIESGTVKMSNGTTFGPVNTPGTIRVKNAAALDMNGAISGEYNDLKCSVILEDGATLTASQFTTAHGGRWSALTTLQLDGNATVDASKANVVMGRTLHYDYCHIILNGNELQKIGNNDFIISHCSLDGTGSFHIMEGTVSIYENYWKGGTGVCNDGTIVIDRGAGFVMNATSRFKTKNLVLNGSINAVTNESVFTVTGYVTGNGTTPMLTLAEGAVFKPTGTGYLTITESLTLPSVLTNDVSGIDFDSTSTVPLFKVGSSEMLPEAESMAFSCGVLPKRWSLGKTSDGLGYRLKKEMSFSIRLR